MIVTTLGSSIDLTTLVFYALSLLPLIGMAEGDDPPSDDKDDPPPDNKNEKMVTMSQNAMNRLIDDRAAGIRVTIDSEYKEQISGLKGEIDALNKKSDTADDDNNDSKSKPDKAVIDAAIEKVTGNLKIKIEELEGQVTEAKNSATVEIEKRKQETKRALVGNALSSLNVLKPDEVYAVLEYNKSIGFDDKGNLVPVTADGNPIIGDGGNPITLDKYLTEYIDARPHLVAPSGRTGSGAQEGGGGAAETTPKDNENFMREALDEADKQEAAGLQTHGKKPVESH